MYLPVRKNKRKLKQKTEKNLENQRIFEENNEDSVNLKDIREKREKRAKVEVFTLYIYRCVIFVKMTKNTIFCKLFVEKVKKVVTKVIDFL